MSVIAVDVGGMSIRGALFADEGAVVARVTFPTRGSGVGSPLEVLRRVIASLVARAKGSVRGIGIATPGTVDTARGVVQFAGNLGWAQLHLRDLIQSEFGSPVVLEHDARAGALAECALDDERGISVFMPIGTGIAAALMVRGEVVYGATGSAGEVGHLIAVRGGEACSCGQYGCVEVYGSAAGIARRYAAATGGGEVDAREVIRRIPRDETASRIWDDALDALTVGIASTVTTLDPGVVILGGGLSQAGPALLNPLNDRLEATFTWRKAPDLRAAVLAPHSTLIGSAVMVATQADARLFAENALRDLADRNVDVIRLR